MLIIYFSPLAFDSFYQRPHYFVNWLLNQNKSYRVIWVDPYPTRLPYIKDFFNSTNDKVEKNNENTRIEVIKPKAFPIEPIIGINTINNFFWSKIHSKTKLADAIIVGKPSLLALNAIEKNSSNIKIYDMMDNFPAFYDGISKYHLAKVEKKIIKQSKLLLTSSTNLKKIWESKHKNIELILNASKELNSNFTSSNQKNKHFVFGYVGTIGKWFDWELVINIAKIRNNDIVKIIGPVYKQPPINKLPSNIIFEPACSHNEAINKMSLFDVGLIPFQINELTNYVDPIKFYEYKSLGLKVISSDFGEMSYRDKENDVYIYKKQQDLKKFLNLVVSTNKIEDTDNFIKSNNWENRFNKLKTYFT